jgi:hypothetical protein
VCNSSACVHFEVEKAKWTESDCICIVDAFLYQQTTRQESSLSNIYDYFEYTSKPSAVSAEGYELGSVMVQLPAYSGRYRFIYARKPWPLKTSIILAVSEEFVLAAKLSSGSPDSSSARRRAAIAIDSKLSFRSIIEDLQNISVLNVSLISLPSHKANRVSAWLWHDRDCCRLVIEAELWTDDESSSFHYGSIVLGGIENYRFRYEASSVMAESCDRIICRLPYEKDTSRSQDLKESVNALPINGSISCQFCSHPLFDLSCIRSIKPLPTGQFDQVRWINVDSLTAYHGVYACL